MTCLKWKVDPSKPCPKYKPLPNGAPCELRKRGVLKKQVVDKEESFCVFEPSKEAV